MGLLSALVLSQATKPNGMLSPQNIMAQLQGKPQGQQQQQHQQQQAAYGQQQQYGAPHQQQGYGAAPPPHQQQQPTYGQPAYGQSGPGVPQQTPSYNSQQPQGYGGAGYSTSPSYGQTPQPHPSSQANAYGQYNNQQHAPYPSSQQSSYGGSASYGQNSNASSFPMPGHSPSPGFPTPGGSASQFPTPQHGYDTTASSVGFPAPQVNHNTYPHPQQYGQPPQPYGTNTGGYSQGGYDPNRGVGTAVGVAAAGAAAYGLYSHHQGSKLAYGAAHTGVGAQGASDPQYIQQELQRAVQDQNLHAFYPPGSLEPLARSIAQSGALNRIAQTWQIPIELALDLTRLALFDVIMYLDDSGSMRFDEGGGRIDDLKLVVTRVVEAATLFDADGISIRFFNSPTGADRVSSVAEAQACLDRVNYNGMTPLGRNLDSKVIQPMLLGPAQAGHLRKPVLVMIVTDGEPSGEPRDQVSRVVQNARDALGRTRYGPDALSIELAAVGNDQGAQNFLQSIDESPEIGRYVDVTSNYEIEAAQVQAKTGMQLSPSMYCVKLLCGACNSAYDLKDEKRAY